MSITVRVDKMGKAGTKVFQLKEDPNDESFGFFHCDGERRFTACSYVSIFFYKKRYNSSNFLKRFNIINIRVLNCMK
jgi:hypothetical protein